MNERARKPDEAPTSVSQRVGKAADALPVDDPSIPVLTERLTLPPLDLDLDFRLPPAPAAEAPARDGRAAPPDDALIEARTQAPDETPAEVPLEKPIDMPVEGPFERAIEPRIEPFLEPSFARPESEPAAAKAAEQTLLRPLTTPGTANPDLEPTQFAPRVPTSLLAASVLAKAEAAPAAAMRDDELTGSQAWGPNRMETDLREMILLDLARRLPNEVEAIVRRYLEGAIDRAVARFAAEARIALAATLREMVDRAVKAELERIKSPRR